MFHQIIDGNAQEIRNNRFVGFKDFFFVHFHLIFFYQLRQPVYANIRSLSQHLDENTNAALPYVFYVVEA